MCQYNSWAQTNATGNRKATGRLSGPLLASDARAGIWFGGQRFRLDLVRFLLSMILTTIQLESLSSIAALTPVNARNTDSKEPCLVLRRLRAGAFFYRRYVGLNSFRHD